MNPIVRAVKNALPVSVKARIIKELDAISCIRFNGWGMRTIHEHPWVGGIGNENFLNAAAEVKKNFHFSEDDGVTVESVDTLMWRHWVVSYCVRHAIRFANEPVDLVECGACDGLTAYFALSETGSQKIKMHLYDAWAPMLKENLLKDEEYQAGNYSNISLDIIKKNLQKFRDKVVYHKGYIPESFGLAPSSPDEISYLRIDLNSAKPTVATLDYFFPKLLKGGVVLFDDYGCAIPISGTHLRFALQTTMSERHEQRSKDMRNSGKNCRRIHGQGNHVRP